MARFIFTFLLLSSAFTMAENPDIVVVNTKPGTRYILRPVSTTGTKLPAWALFTCLQGDEILGTTSFLFSETIEPEVWNFWKPILEKIAAKKTIELEIDGGFCLGPATSPESSSGWVPAVAARSQQAANIKVTEKGEETTPSSAQ